jgi:small conductance mechanosensitive channel
MEKKMPMLENFMVRDIANPATFLGAVFYALLLLSFAWLMAHLLHLAVIRVLERDNRFRLDHTVAIFLTQLAKVGIYIFALIFYAHLIPELRAVGTALLTGASIASIVIGLAAQNTLGNLISGISLLLYRPFYMGDRVQITAPTGLETGNIESLTLGYTILRTSDNRHVVVPNSVMASQIMINLTAKDP